MKADDASGSILVMSLGFCEALAAAQEPSHLPPRDNPDADHGRLEEVVVTAQHRLEDRCSGPRSPITAHRAFADRSSICRSLRLSRLVPNLQVGQFTYSRVYCAASVTTRPTR